MGQIEISEFKALIGEMESKLTWGSMKNWTNYDFERLSDLIDEKISTRLSISTLKRIFGKVQYQGDPSLHTLNTLCKFLDYKDWRAFQNRPSKYVEMANLESFATINNPPEQPSNKIISQRAQLRFKADMAFIFLCMGLIIVAALFLIIAAAIKPKTTSIVNRELFSFQADKMFTKGLPNSVVFTYDATKATTDSIYIAQTWDVRRKTLVNKLNHHHSAIYYYPGYFRSKLIIDSLIVKTHDLQIATDGWLGLIERPEGYVPLYFTTDDITADDLTVEVTEHILKKYNLSLLPSTPRLRFFNQGDLGDINSYDFSFETNIKTDFSAGDGVCQFVEILIQCKDDIIIIPLAAKACIGNLYLRACGAFAESKSADLSGFGADLQHWTSLKVNAENGSMAFYVNDKKAYELKLLNNATGIVGVQYRFNGVGSVKNTFFTYRGKKIAL